MSGCEKRIVLLTDPFSADPDDILAVLLTLSWLKTEPCATLKIVVTHFFAEDRAQTLAAFVLALLNHDQHVMKRVEIVASSTTKLRTQGREQREEFVAENPMFPLNVFGVPVKGAQKAGEKQWFPDFLAAYTPLHRASAGDVKTGSFVDDLSKASPENRLVVICIAPPHDLAELDVKLFPNMALYVMGGGFEEMKDGKVSCSKLGYNWGIAPEITQMVLTKLSQSKTRATLISSQFVRRKNLQLSTCLYNHWREKATHASASASAPTFAPAAVRCFLDDFDRCLRSNKLPPHKNLCDPACVQIAMDHIFRGPQLETIPIQFSIRRPPLATSYLDASEYVDMALDAERANVNLVIDCPPWMIQCMCDRIEDVLFPASCQDIVGNIRGEEKERKEHVYQSKTWIRVDSSVRDFKFDAKSIEAQILAGLGLPSKPTIVQVVGDFQAFPTQRVQHALAFLAAAIMCSPIAAPPQWGDWQKQIFDPLARFAQDHPFILQYGFTGNSARDPKVQFQAEADANHLVSLVIDGTRGAIPSFANVVDHHSVQALTQWGCSWSRYNGAFVVWCNKGKALFGDDVQCDLLCNRLILLEGGAQSWLQAVQVLVQGGTIDCAWNLRTEEGRELFSASEFLDYCKTIETKDWERGPEFVDSIVVKFLQGRKMTDIHSPHYLTKQPLFVRAWSLFKEHRVWSRLSRVQVVRL